MSNRTRHRYAGLIALNAVAIALLALVSFTPGASAEQQPRSTRGRGDYTMVSAKIQGQQESGVFIIDSSNSEMLVIKWDSGRRAITGLGYRNLTTDAGQVGPKGK
ncbi:MAG TPA: hypothetical protein VG797_03635 [Phycisphaerales bacterium]|nr:hypothetical protein [Phycisphaerales bacterium]